jgi:hypothetical protein
LISRLNCIKRRYKVCESDGVLEEKFLFKMEGNLCENCGEEASRILVSKRYFVRLCFKCERLGDEKVKELCGDRCEDDLRITFDRYLHKLKQFTRDILTFTQHAHDLLERHKQKALLECENLKLKVIELLKLQNAHLVSLPLNFSILESPFHDSLSTLFSFHTPSSSFPDPQDSLILSLQSQLSNLQSFIDTSIYQYTEVPQDSIPSSWLYFNASYNLYRINPLTYQTDLLYQDCYELYRSQKCILPNSEVFFAGSICEFSNKAYIFSPDKRRIYRLENMSINRSTLGLAYLRRKVYLFGGSGTKRAEMYELERNRWRQLPDSVLNHESCICVGIGEKIYIISGNYLGFVEVFDTVKMSYLMVRHCILPIVKAVFWIEERVYIIGEHDLQVLDSEFEIVYEERDKWDLNLNYENQVVVGKDGFIFISQYGCEVLYFEFKSKQIYNMKDIKLINSHTIS